MKPRGCFRQRKNRVDVTFRFRHAGGCWLTRRAGVLASCCYCCQSVKSPDAGSHKASQREGAGSHKASQRAGWLLLLLLLPVSKVSRCRLTQGEPARRCRLTQGELACWLAAAAAASRFQTERCTHLVDSRTGSSPVFIRNKERPLGFCTRDAEVLGTRSPARPRASCSLRRRAAPACERQGGALS